MRTWFAVVRFEVERSWLVVVAGVLAGLAALAAPAVWGLGLDAPAEVRATAAPLLAFLLLVVGGGLLGARSLAGPVVSRGEGFFLSWPVGSAVLWSARLAAVTLLAGTAALLALLPVAVVQPAAAVSWSGEAGSVVPEALGAVLLAATAAALLRVLAAARSPWLLVLIGAGAVAWRLVSVALTLGVMAVVSGGLSAGIGALAGPAWAVVLLAALAGSLAAAVGGRGELGRTARWGGAASSVVLLVAAAAYWGWLHAALSPRPSGVTRVTSAVTPAGGGWALVAGEAPRLGLRPTGVFLVDLARGAWRPLGVGGARVRTGDAVAAGPYLAHGYVSPRLGLGRTEVLRMDPEGARRRAVVRAAGYPVAISPDGRLLALRSGNGPVRVVRVDDGGIERTVRIREGASLLAIELDLDGTLRAMAMLGGDSGPVTARLVSPPGTDRWREAWRAEGRFRGFADGAPPVVVVRNLEEDEAEASVRRLEDGRELWRCRVPAGSWCVLVDGGRLLVLPREGRRELSLCTPQGVAWRVESPYPVTWSVASGCPSPGTVLVELDRGGGGRTKAGVWALDLATGALHLLGRDLSLAGWPLLVPWPRPVLVIRRDGVLLRVTPAPGLEPVPVR